MPKLVERYLEPGYVDLGLVFDAVGPLLFPDKWTSNRFMEETPFYVKKVDLITGREVCIVRKTLVRQKLPWKVDYDPYDLPEEDIDLAKDAEQMWLKTYEHLIASAANQRSATIVVITLPGAYIPFSSIPPGRWFRTPRLVRCTGYIKTADGYGRVVLTKSWRDSVIAELSERLAKRNLHEDVVKPDRQPNIQPANHEVHQVSARQQSTSPAKHRPSVKGPLVAKALSAIYGKDYRAEVKPIAAPTLARIVVNWLNENEAWPDPTELPVKDRDISSDLIKTFLERRKPKRRLPKKV